MTITARIRWRRERARNVFITFRWTFRAEWRICDLYDWEPPEPERE